MFTLPPYVTCHMSGVTCQMSHVRCQVTGVRCHASGVTVQVSGVTILFLFSFFLSGWTSWWRVCYQWCLPRLFQGQINLITQVKQAEAKLGCYKKFRQIYAKLRQIDTNAAKLRQKQPNIGKLRQIWGKLRQNWGKFMQICPGPI